MKLNQLLEKISTGPLLYHATNLDSVVHILSGNSLRADTEHLISDINPELRHQMRDKNDYGDRDDTVSGVSLTRDKKFAEGWSDVILVIDWNKLKQNHKIKQVSYYGDDAGSNREESEEFVIGSIKNLDRYIAGIYFPARLEKQYTDWAWVQKNIAHVPEEFKGWKMVVESPKYSGKPIQNMPQQKKAVNEYVMTNTGSVLWQQGPFKAVSRQFGATGTAVDMFDGDKKIGHLIVEEFGSKEYADVMGAVIYPSYQKRGLGKILYQLVLKGLKPQYKGIRSALSARANKDAIPAIYKSLGGFEKDGYAYINKPGLNERYVFDKTGTVVDKDFNASNIHGRCTNITLKAFGVCIDKPVYNTLEITKYLKDSGFKIIDIDRLKYNYDSYKETEAYIKKNGKTPSSYMNETGIDTNLYYNWDNLAPYLNAYIEGMSVTKLIHYYQLKINLLKNVMKLTMIKKKF
jgi:ribosomal protein S18 acetylase RimI-like enzyme